MNSQWNAICDNKALQSCPLHNLDFDRLQSAELRRTCANSMEFFFNAWRVTIRIFIISEFQLNLPMTPHLTSTCLNMKSEFCFRRKFWIDTLINNKMRVCALETSLINGIIRGSRFDSISSQSRQNCSIWPFLTFRRNNSKVLLIRLMASISIANKMKFIQELNVCVSHHWRMLHSFQCQTADYV